MSRIKIILPIIILTIIIILLVFFLNRSVRYNSLEIEQSKWEEIISSRTESSNLRLEQIKFNDYALIADNNILYYSVINDSANKYNPSVAFKASDNSANIAILKEEITDEKIHSNYKFKIMIYNETEYHIYDLIYTDLPLLDIKVTKVDANKQKTIQVKIYLFNNLSNTPNRILISDGKLKIDGDSYMFSMQMLTPGKNVRENKKPIFNLPPRSEYVLTKAEGSLSGKQVVELFINNEYKGQYVIDIQDVERKEKWNF